MASTYVNNLRLNEMATGDASGTWGTITNTNLELIGEALGFGTEAITTNADTHTTTVADGASDGGRAMYLKYTGTLDSACTITIAPNTMKRMQFIENGTSGSQNIIISQGSGANITIPPGDTKAVYLDGAGSGAAVVDAFASLNVVDLKVEDDLTVTDDASVGGDLLVSGEVQTANIGFTDGDNAMTIADGGAVTFPQTSVFTSGFTASAGATITTADNNAQLTLVSTDADNSSGPIMELYRNSSSPADDDFIGRVKFIARNDNSQDFVGIDMIGRVIDASDGTEDSEFRLTTMRAGTQTTDLKITSSGVSSVPEIVFNEDGTDLDFRVEGSSVTNVIFVNAGDNDLHIGTGADLITDTAGTSNTRIGVNAGNSIQSGGNYNVVVGDEAGTAITTGDNNTLLGYQTGDALTTPFGNVAIGDRALSAETTGQRNTAVGSTALFAQNNTGNELVYNTAVGYQTGAAITTGSLNTFVGALSGDALTTGTTNCALGYLTLSAETTGLRNTAMGYSALANQNSTAGHEMYNTAYGFFAGLNITTGLQNVLIGGDAGDALTDADYNVAVGRGALSADTLGSRSVAIGHTALENQNFTSATNAYNVCIGYEAGHDITTGQQNTLVGGLAGDKLTDADYNVVMGLNSLGTDVRGSRSTAVGYATLAAQNFSSATNTHNSAFGYSAGTSVTTGTTNTYLGAQAGATSTTASNNTCVGAYAGSDIVDGSANIMIGVETGISGTALTTGSENIFIGNGISAGLSSGTQRLAIGHSVAPLGDNYFTFGKGTSGDRVYNSFTANASWTRHSDERLKKDIQDNTDCGLNFINDLRPVTFKFKSYSEVDQNLSCYDANATEVDYPNKMYGLIAQEVKQAMEDNNITDFGGWDCPEENGLQGIAQEMFVHPLIKAVQELSAQVTALQSEVKALKGE